MGLDMFLGARNRASGDVVDVGYWRKANAIHKWFVDNTQEGIDECQESVVTSAQLLDLKVLCEAVLKTKQTASSFLPTRSGFFFGSTDYDDRYFQDLRDTIEIVDKILETKPESDWEYIYQSSW